MLRKAIEFPLIVFSLITLMWFVLLLSLKDCSIKVNVDGSSFDNPCNTYFDNLLSNNNGVWIQGFSISCGRASYLFVELSTIL